MSGDSDHNPARPDSELELRFAAFIIARRETIVSSYVRSLEAMHSPLVAQPHARSRVMAYACDILTDVAAVVAGREVQVDDRYALLAWTAGDARTESQLSPADLLRAAPVFFDAAVGSIGERVTDDPELLPCFLRAVTALNESVNRRIGQFTLAHTGDLLERVDQAHIDERHRIARDLHDRLGEGMSAALRQLELHEIISRKEPLAASPRAAVAKEALAEAMRRLRLVTSDLRQDSVRSLEKALVQYLDSATVDADVRLRVSGDETWAPPAVLEEAFLIMREAIRNALAHGKPRMVLIGVALAPHELHARVEDDGAGFTLAGVDSVPAGTPASASVPAGTGIASMRERASLVGGRLTITSAAGQGTQVELFVPLDGNHHAKRG